MTRVGNPNDSLRISMCIECYSFHLLCPPYRRIWLSLDSQTSNDVISCSRTSGEKKGEDLNWWWNLRNTRRRPGWKRKEKEKSGGEGRRETGRKGGEMKWQLIEEISYNWWPFWLLGAGLRGIPGIPGSRDLRLMKIPGFLKMKSRDFSGFCADWIHRVL